MSDPGQVKGHQRVAAFLLSLDPEVATKILRGLNEDVVSEVSQAMIDLDSRVASHDAVEDLYRDIAKSIHGKREIRPCDESELSTLLGGSLGAEKGKTVMAEIEERRKKTRPFLRIEEYPPHLLYQVLEVESPAVTALVLAHLAPATSAQILSNYEPDDAVEIIRRMASLTPPKHAMLQSIATELEPRVQAAANETGGSTPEERLQSLADLLNFSSPELEKNVFETLSEDDAEMAAVVREHMFTWDDISTIDKRSMQKILGTVDTKTLSVALKACNPEVEENVLGNLSSRVRDMVAEERELVGAVPMSEVTSAREEIMRNIRAMIEAGEFKPQKGAEDLVS